MSGDLPAVLRGIFGPEGQRWIDDPANFRPCADCGEELSGLVLEPDGAWRCPACIKAGVETERAGRRAAGAAKDRCKALRAAEVPERYVEIPFDPTPPCAADAGPYAQCLAWTGKPWCILLCGHTGNGKSMLAVETLHRAMLRGSSARFVRASRVPGIWYDGEGDEREQLLGPRYLVVDELGAGHPGGGWEAIEDLVSGRWEQSAPTVFTSNLLSLPAILEAARPFGARMVDRLNEGLVLNLAGKTRRKPHVDSGARR